ncbi:MAG TPA: tetratricopeptide repeat protein [Steroidobacteraceae bacterium]
MRRLCDAGSLRAPRPTRDTAASVKAEGNLLKAMGERGAAIARYRRALELDGDYLPALYNLGLALHETGSYDEAEACFRRLVQAQPGDVDAWFHLGALLRRRMQFKEAVATYERALEHAPDDPQAWLGLGDSILSTKDTKQIARAVSCYARAAELAPDLYAAHFNRGCAAAMAGEHAEALLAFRAAAALHPEDPECLASLLWQMQQACDWSGFEDLCRRRREVALTSQAPLDPFPLLTIASALPEQLASASAYARRIAQEALAGASRGALRRARRPGSGKIRIGYLSADFHEHVTAHVMAEVFEKHRRDRFEIAAYSYGPDDGSAVRARLKGAFDDFVELAREDDDAAAARIAADGIDVLIELKGYTRDARPGIAARRPAPVQASYLGYPGTMGASFIDYIVTDRFVLPPEDQPFYKESPAYVRGCYYPSDSTRPVGDAPSRRELGLPEHELVFCCFNQSYKILPDVFAAWMRLLQAIPRSVLWLLESNRWANENLLREALRCGIDRERLVISGRTSPTEYLRRLRAADLFLDTVPYNAHTTASDALWVGLPVLTCAGETLPSRVAASQLHALGLGDLVTTSLEHYLARAIQLARSSSELQAVRARVWRARSSSRLFDTVALCRDLESLYEQMHRIAAQGAPPGPISA